MIEVTRGSKNVYADLGFPDADEMAIKSQLVGTIGETLAHRKWNQQKAAEALGIPPQKLSEMLRGQFHDVSLTKLFEYLNRLGHDVQILVGPARSNNEPGRIDVVFTD